MKKLFRILLPALAATLLAAVSCNEAPQAAGKSFDELPALQKTDMLAFFKALPAQLLPEKMREDAERERYFKAYRFMAEDGILADGEGPEETALKTDNALMWTDYLDTPDGFDYDGGDEDTPHPYLILHLYQGADEGKAFGIVRAGAYVNGGEQKEPERYFWMDKESGKLTEAKLKLNPPYTADDLTADVLTTYGCENLFYSVKSNKFTNHYHDRGMVVLIDEVGLTQVAYEWNGVEFVRDPSYKLPCIYNFGFAHIMLGETVPFSIPGYSTDEGGDPYDYETIYHLTKKGESSPTLIFHADNNTNVFEIEVCSGPYTNAYGIGPGTPVDDLYKVNESISKRWGENYTLTINDLDSSFVYIYASFDEDFVYSVPRDQYLGDEKFAPGAKIARVSVINSVG